MLQPYAPAMGSAMTHDLEDLKAIWLDLMAHVEQLAGERTEVTLTARPVERQGIVGGLCWRLEAMQ